MQVEPGLLPIQHGLGRADLCLPDRPRSLSPDWLRDIDWTGRTVSVNVTREKVKSSPEYDPSIDLQRGYEEDLYRHYGFAPYWGGSWV